MIASEPGRSVRCAFVAALFFLLLYAPFGANAGNRFALLVGHNRGDRDEEPLRYAERDARRMREVLVEAGDFEKKDCILLSAPTAEQLDRAAEEMKNRIQASKPSAPRVLFVYFAGHGDKESLHLGGERYARSRLESETDTPAADVKIVVVDACRTFDASRTMGVSVGAGFDVSIVPTAKVQGRVTILSSQTGEPSLESERLEGAVFSHHLIGALRGAADLDADGKVTLLEAYRYAYRGTVKDSGRTASVVQHPNFDIDLFGTEDFVMTTPAAASSSLMLSAVGPTSFQVFSLPYYSPVAELTVAPNHSVTVAVPAGRLLIQRRSQDTLTMAEIKVNRGERRRVTPSEYKEMSFDVTRKRGGPTDPAPNGIRLAFTGAGEHFVDRWIPRYGGLLGYERRFRALRAAFHITTAYARYETDAFSNREVDLLVGLGVGAGRTVKMHSFGLVVGPELDVRFQHRTRLDADRFTVLGMENRIEERLHAAAFGGFFDLRWDLTLTARLDFCLSVKGAVSAMPLVRAEASDYVLSAAVGAAAGLNYRF